MNSVVRVRTRLIRSQAAAVRLTALALFLGLSCAAPALFAQSTASIVPIQDSRGRQVFINTEAPARSRTASPASAAALRAAPGLENLIQDTAGRLRVDPKLVNAMIRVESEFDARAVSPKGAIGLMQLMPATATRLRIDNPFDPQENVRGGVTFLRYLLDRFNGSVPLSLAAYNAGEDRVARDGGIPAIRETVNYVRKVTSLYRAGQPASARTPARGAAATPAEPVFSYVDAYGVVHFTNDGGIE